MDLGNIYDAETDDENENPPKPKRRKQVNQQKKREATQRVNGSSSQKTVVAGGGGRVTRGNQAHNQEGPRPSSEQAIDEIQKRTEGLRKYRSARRLDTEQAINETLKRNLGDNTTINTLMSPEQLTGKDLIEFLQQRTPNSLFQAPSALIQRAAEAEPLFLLPVTLPCPSALTDPIQYNPVQYHPSEDEILNSGPQVQIGNTRFPNLRSALASASTLIPADPGLLVGDGRDAPSFEHTFIDQYPYYDDSPRYFEHESLPAAFYRVLHARNQMGVITRQIPISILPKPPGESVDETLRRNQEVRSVALKEDAEHKKKLDLASKDFNGRSAAIWYAQQKMIKAHNAQQRAMGLQSRKAFDLKHHRPAGPDPVVAEELNHDLYDFSWFRTNGRPVEKGPVHEGTLLQRAGDRAAGENRIHQDDRLLAGPSMVEVGTFGVVGDPALRYDDCENCQRHGRQCQESRPCFECVRHNLVCTGSFLDDPLIGGGAFEEAFYEPGDDGSDELGYGDPMDFEEYHLNFSGVQGIIAAASLRKTMGQ